MTKTNQESENLKELDFLLADNLSSSVSSEEEPILKIVSTSFELWIYISYLYASNETFAKLQC